MIGFVGLPVAIGIAILRYRLYEIDIIINRTLVYGALTVVLAGIFQTIDAALHYLLVTLAHLHTLPGSIIAALIVGALFHPVRHRIQRFVDGHLPSKESGRSGRSEEHTSRLSWARPSGAWWPRRPRYGTDRAKTMKGEDVDHQDAFTTETAGLPEASSPGVVRLYGTIVSLGDDIEAGLFIGGWQFRSHRRRVMGNSVPKQSATFSPVLSNLLGEW
jgi:hypothetical protein